MRLTILAAMKVDINNIQDDLQLKLKTTHEI